MRQTVLLCARPTSAAPSCNFQQFVNFKRNIGITNSVLTYGLSYGHDCTSLEPFIRQLGKTRTKDVGVVDPETTTDEQIDAMHPAGVRGIRVNLYKYRAMDNFELQKVALGEHAGRIQRCPGWTMAFTHTHQEFWRELRMMTEHELVPGGVRLVTDHFALLKGESMLATEYRRDVTSRPGFQDIIQLVRDGYLWVKLSAPYRVSELKPDYPDMKLLVRALVNANPRRVIWGSDWYTQHALGWTCHAYRT